MSRSRQKSWVHKWACARSERAYKRIRAGRERARVRQALHHGEWEKAEVELARWEEWHTGRDGYVGYWTERRARESAERFVELFTKTITVEQYLHRLYGK